MMIVLQCIVVGCAGIYKHTCLNALIDTGETLVVGLSS